MIACLRTLTPGLVLSLWFVSSFLSVGCAQIAPAETSPEATRGWKIEFESSGSRPVIADGVLYVGSVEGTVYALDSKTGATKWRFQTGKNLSAATSRPQVIAVPPGTSTSEQMSAGMQAAASQGAAGIRRVDMTPTIASGTVFIGAGDHSFYALDAATGQEKWAYVAGPGLAATNNLNIPHPAPIVQRGIVYFVVEDGLHALDIMTGKRTWYFPGRDLTKRLAQGLVQGDSAIFLSGRDHVYAFAAESGVVRWMATLDGIDTTAPIAAKGLVLVASHPSTLLKSSQRETLYAIDAADGKIRWTLAADRMFGTSRLLVAGNTIYFSTDKTLLAIDLDTGRQFWSFSADEIQGDIKADDHHVFVVTHKRSMARPRDTLHALARATGKETWSQRLSGSGSVALLHDGVVYSRRDAIDAATGKTLWSVRGTGREEALLVAEGRVFLISPTVTYSGLSRVDQGYLQALDARTGTP